MRALAEFVMRGRVQAILVAVVGIFLPFFAWISAAVIGLVVLRKGTGEGFLVLSWALLAALTVLFWRGDIGPVTALTGTAIAALTLRWTVSWPYALIAATVFGVVMIPGARSLGAETRDDGPSAKTVTRIVELPVVLDRLILPVTVTVKKSFPAESLAE